MRRNLLSIMLICILEIEFRFKIHDAIHFTKKCHITVRQNEDEHDLDIFNMVYLYLFTQLMSLCKKQFSGVI